MDGQYSIVIILPRDISRDDEERLNKCVGTILFTSVLKKRIFLHELDARSYGINGRAVDYLTMLNAYRRRFPILVTGALRGELRAIALNVGYPRGLTVKNTGPYDLLNGDLICLIPPLPGLTPTIQLSSCDTELVFPMTLPIDAAREIIGKIISSMTYEFCLRNQLQVVRPVNALRTTYRNRSIELTPAITDGSALQEMMHTLFTSMMFAVHEGVLILLMLMPTLLAGGAVDPFTNALVQMRTATRLSVQLLRPPILDIPDPNRGNGRNNIFEMLSIWIAMATQLGDALGLKPAIKVCLYHAESTVIKEGEIFSAIVP
ncbi:capsid triplex subunit 2 [Psittacid alphaherpesvirus 5]|uniref:Capsid triplex subunit 2 n=1 Tax=Psittacid alphaherpesvirus 5 TaxID=2972693 RepID=A0A5P9JX27_9ALPH|nr:capsid triplex subunit 2 [Psittacid alphaherpesvirus 5]QFU14584.1 capsid triplex subunit 2 [Psittacid alphaherpesvirus 5]UOO01055.1 capsid triplex subunit 2 [Psittacid alphaherpesvirus 5]